MITIPLLILYDGTHIRPRYWENKFTLYSYVKSKTPICFSRPSFKNKSDQWFLKVVTISVFAEDIAVSNCSTDGRSPRLSTRSTSPLGRSNVRSSKFADCLKCVSFLLVFFFATGCAKKFCPIYGACSANFLWIHIHILIDCRLP